MTTNFDKNIKQFLEGNSRSKAIYRCNGIDANGNKVTFHVGDYVKVLDETPRHIDYFYNKISRINKIVGGYHGYLISTDLVYSNHYRYKDGDLKYKDGNPVWFGTDMLLKANYINQVKPKDRQNLSDILDI